MCTGRNDAHVLKWALDHNCVYLQLPELMLSYAIVHKII